MIDLKLLLARILNQLIPMNRLDIEEYILLDGGTSIDAGGYKMETLNISKPGYYPVAISGYYSNLARIAPFRLQLRDIDDGSGQIEWGVTNVRNSKQSPTFRVNVLWEKIN